MLRLQPNEWMTRARSSWCKVSAMWRCLPNSSTATARSRSFSSSEAKPPHSARHDVKHICLSTGDCLLPSISPYFANFRASLSIMASTFFSSATTLESASSTSACRALSVLTKAVHSKKVMCSMPLRLPSIERSSASFTAARFLSRSATFATCMCHTTTTLFSKPFLSPKMHLRTATCEASCARALIAAWEFSKAASLASCSACVSAKKLRTCASASAWRCCSSLSWRSLIVSCFQLRKVMCLPDRSSPSKPRSKAKCTACRRDPAVLTSRT
mmetsp:Transcript_133098/g.385029  ORF Transcript_133098/g.385029 Transcript_133098/m.385029 type:complete len:272 (+) Transcript_133098:994-1809(+)